MNKKTGSYSATNAKTYTFIHRWRCICFCIVLSQIILVFPILTICRKWQLIEIPTYLKKKLAFLLYFWFWGKSFMSCALHSKQQLTFHIFFRVFYFLYRSTIISPSNTINFFIIFSYYLIISWAIVNVLTW